MSPFTDEDVKRLKEFWNQDFPTQGEEDMGNDVLALIARLEAAERCIESLCVDEADMAAWKKACGKERQ